MSSRRRGFTLVELLVVIGIVTVLIAVLVPALARARTHARRVHCMANLRSLGQALTMYTQQTGYYPGCCAFQPDGSMPAIWPTRLRLFTGGDTGVFLCPERDERFAWNPREVPPLVSPFPSDPNSAGPRRIATDLDSGYGYVAGERVVLTYGNLFSYGYNLWGFDHHAGENAGLGAYIRAPVGYTYERELRASRVKVASEMIAIGDSLGDGFRDVCIEASPNDDPKGRDWPGTVHDGGANILFCDGHVTWHLQRDLVNVQAASPASHQMRRMWNNYHGP